MSAQLPFLRTLTVLSCFLAAGCGSKGGKGTTSLPPQGVSAAPVTSQKLHRSLIVAGTLMAHDQSPISVKVPGRLQSLPVDLGSVVHRGELLAQIDPRDYELRKLQSHAALAQARARLGLPLDGEDDSVEIVETSIVKQANAVKVEKEKELERVSQLSQQGIASQAELEVAQASHEVALNKLEDAVEEARTRQAALAQRRAEFLIAAQQLEDTRVIAPFDGAVQERRANIGEYLTTGAPVVTLVRIDPLRLRVEVSERDARRLRTGQEVAVFVEGDTNAYAGSVRRLSPAISERSRVLVVEADVPARGALKPGLFARAEIRVAGDAPVLAMPREALVTFAGIEKVFVVENGRAAERFIETGDRSGDIIEVLSGLKERDLVVLNPGGLQGGRAVEIRR